MSTQVESPLLCLEGRNSRGTSAAGSGTPPLSLGQTMQDLAPRSGPQQANDDYIAAPAPASAALDQALQLFCAQVRQRPQQCRRRRTVSGGGSARREAAPTGILGTVALGGSARAEIAPIGTLGSIAPPASSRRASASLPRASSSPLPRVDRQQPRSRS